MFAIDAVTTEVEARGKAAVIAVADAYGEIIAMLRMDGASLTSGTIAQKKAFTAAREGRPSKAVGDRIRDPERGHDVAFYGDDRYIGWGGGIPVIVNGVCCGAVAISGLPEAEDIEICEGVVDRIVSTLT